MLEMRVNGATSAGVTLVQFFPPSRVTWIRPSSEPVQMSPFTRGDSASAKIVARSEEHTSELQSPDHLVCRLLLEKINTIVTGVQKGQCFVFAPIRGIA